MKNKIKKYLWLIVIIFLIISIGFIFKTYALLESNGTGEASEDVGKWVIKLNGTDISNGINENFVINNIIYTDNENVADGYIAPGRSGYFDIILDPSGTQVAVRYDIKIDLASTTYAPNVQFSINDLSGGNAILTAENTYSGVVDLNSIAANTTITLRLNLTWQNNESYDSQDSDLGTTKGNKISVPVNIRVSQYLGETITPYQ